MASALFVIGAECDHQGSLDPVRVAVPLSGYRERFSGLASARDGERHRISLLNDTRPVAELALSILHLLGCAVRTRELALNLRVIVSAILKKSLRDRDGHNESPPFLPLDLRRLVGDRCQSMDDCARLMIGAGLEGKEVAQTVVTVSMPPAGPATASSPLILGCTKLFGRKLECLT